MREARTTAPGGAAFALLFFVAFVLFAGEAPGYAAPDAEWIRWTEANEAGNRVALLLMVLAAVGFLLFAGALRHALDGSALATTALAGGTVGVTGMVIAVVLTTIATAHGAESDPTITRPLVEAAGTGFLLASVGFCAHLLAVGRETLRTGAFARWSGIVALVGAGAFLVTFLTALDPSSISAFGIGYPIGFLCLVVWTMAASVRLSAAATQSRARPLPSTR